MEKDELFKIYELSIKEVEFASELYQKRVQYFTTLISTLFGITLAAIIKVDQWWHYLLLIFALCIVFIVCYIGKKAIARIYLYILEVITSRAKTEQALGLTSKLNIKKDGAYWQEEQIIPKRHIDSREKYQSSEEFINDLKDKGYYSLIKKLFSAFQLISIALAVGLVILSISKYSESPS